MDTARKQEWARFWKASAGALGLCLLIWLLQLVFLVDPISYLVPGILFLISCYIAFGYEQVGVDKALRLVRFGLATVVFCASIWLSLPDNKPVLITWQPFTNEALEKAKKENNPVLINFTASWCGPCHELERQVFTKQDVANEMKRFVLLQVDMSDESSPRTAEYAQRFQVDGYPTILFYDRNGRENRGLRVEGLIGPNEFLQHLASVK